MLADGVLWEVDVIESDIASCTASVVGHACLLPQASSRFHQFFQYVSIGQFSSICAPGYTNIGHWLLTS